MADTCQALFHREWQHLHNPHVRALAWMLCSPSLLDADSPLWHQQLAKLVAPDGEKLKPWLTQLEQDPANLLQALALHKHRRLGHYAENLLAFYLQHEGLLYAHGLQVHSEQSATIGEFDFLLKQPDGLLHWEIATKFYLLEEGGKVDHQIGLNDYLGPNLADTLGLKMQKIFRQQLVLSSHAAAVKILPQKVIAAEALIKGWLFYRHSTIEGTPADGIAKNHCRGYWWTMDEVSRMAIPNALILPRLQWLAPAQTCTSEVIDKANLQDILCRHFELDKTPVMVAIMHKNGDVMQEFCRGMVVPDDWLSRAREMRRLSAVKNGPHR
jgi:hypothetical protein